MLTLPSEVVALRVSWENPAPSDQGLATVLGEILTDPTGICICKTPWKLVNESRPSLDVLAK